VNSPLTGLESKNEKRQALLTPDSRPLGLMLSVRAAWELFLVSVAFVL